MIVAMLKCCFKSKMKVLSLEQKVRKMRKKRINQLIKKEKKI